MKLTKKEKWCLGGLVVTGAGAGFAGGLFKDYPSLNTTAGWQYMLVGTGAALALFAMYKLYDACVRKNDYESINDPQNNDNENSQSVIEPQMPTKG